MYRLGKFQFESFKYTPGHRANYAVLTKPDNRRWGMKYSPTYSYSHEYEMLKKFSHPQIPARYDYGNGELFENDKLVLKEHYIVIQHFEGEDIVEHYKKIGLPDSRGIDKILKYLSSVSDPLSYLHSKKRYIHADIKPGHIIVNPETDTAAIIDLELAVKIGGVIKGITKEYAAPEQRHMIVLLRNISKEKDEKTILSQVEIDGRADLYSIGLISYEILTGKSWREANHPPSDINNSIPQKLNKIIMGLLEEKPENRIPSAESLKNELEDV